MHPVITGGSAARAPDAASSSSPSLGRVLSEASAALMYPAICGGNILHPRALVNVNSRKLCFSVVAVPYFRYYADIRS